MRILRTCFSSQGIYLDDLVASKQLYQNELEEIRVIIQDAAVTRLEFKSVFQIVSSNKTEYQHAQIKNAENKFNKLKFPRTKLCHAVVVKFRDQIMNALKDASAPEADVSE